jgi:hypothetical protein
VCGCWTGGGADRAERTGARWSRTVSRQRECQAQRQGQSYGTAGKDGMSYADDVSV